MFGAILGAVGGLAGNILGGSKEADAASRAAELQRAGIRKTMGVQTEMYERMRGLQQPYMQAGQQTAPHLMGLMTGQRGVMDDPLAQRQQSTGLDMLRSRFGGDLSSGVVSGFGGRVGALEQTAQRNRLGRMVDIGMGGASGLAGAGQQQASALSNALSASTNISNLASMNRSNINQQIFGDVAYGMGQIPSTMATNRYLQDQQRMFGGY